MEYSKWQSKFRASSPSDPDGWGAKGTGKRTCDPGRDKQGEYQKARNEGQQIPRGGVPSRPPSAVHTAGGESTGERSRQGCFSGSAQEPKKEGVCVLWQHLLWVS